MSGLTPQDKQAIDVFQQRLQQAFPHQVDQLYLFGSKARGEAGPESDIDVLVIMKQLDWPIERQILRLATDIFMQTGIDLSPIVYSRQTINLMHQRHNVFMQYVDQDAVPL